MRIFGSRFFAALGVAILGGLSVITTQPVLAQQTPTLEQMWEIIQQQQAEIERLQRQLGQANTKIEETEVKVTATADAVENVVGSQRGAVTASDTNIGGYGELHYNNLSNETTGGSDKDEVDLHRFVLYLNHQFSDSVRFFSEVEIEHSLAGDGKPGEVELEQAFIEWDLNQDHKGKAGLFLVPVGILNETHEPDTFYGVERNNVEKNIIPTTWWEAGAGLSGEVAPGWQYDVAIHSGLDMAGGSVRGGRQKVAQAKADNFAYTGRLRYTGIAGLELGATLQMQTDVLQNEIVMGASNVGATLLEAHASYQNGPFSLRALYATWDIDNGINLITIGAEEQEGWYLEPSFRVNDNLGLFARFSTWDNQSASATDTEYEQTDIGLSYWLTENVVFKADYQDQTVPAGQSEYDGLNLGVGWSF